MLWYDSLAGQGLCIGEDVRCRAAVQARDMGVFRKDTERFTECLCRDEDVLKDSPNAKEYTPRNTAQCNAHNVKYKVMTSKKRKQRVEEVEPSKYSDTRRKINPGTS